jgi:hypothetical protein
LKKAARTAFDHRTAHGEGIDFIAGCSVSEGQERYFYTSRNSADEGWILWVGRRRFRGAITAHSLDLRFDLEAQGLTAPLAVPR